MATTVLVVEDERKLRDFIRSYLERAGFTVLSTGSGAEAITMATDTAPDLVVLDLGLPDVPGETVARELRAMSAIPILMLTVKAAEEDRVRGLELGADDYVTKPFSPRELVLRVQAIVRRGVPTAAAHGVASYGSGALVIDEPRRTLVGLTAAGLGAADAVLRSALLRAIAGTAGLAALLALAAGLGVYRRITRAVARLIRVTRAMASGDRSARASQIKAPGELRELAAAFDQMADTLDHEDKIRRDLVASVAH